MTKKIFHCFTLIILLIITSCSTMYIPSTTNIPLLEKKGEKQIELTASTNSIHLTGNYAFSKKYSAMANGGLSYGNFTNSYDLFTSKGYRIEDDGSFSIDLTEHGEFAHKYIEIGIGRYNILEQTKKLEIFGGVGYGVADDKTGSTIGTLNFDANYYLGFAQINFGKTLSTFDFGWALRIASSFYDYTYQIDPDSNYSEDNNGLPQNIKFNMIHVEPMGFMRFGNERLKFVTRIGCSLAKPIQSLGDIDVNRGIYSGDVNATFLHFSIGINYKFEQKNK